MKEIPKIGAYVLESLTTGMYTNPLDSLREYVQNSSDSIFTAEKHKILENNRGVITITLDPGQKTISIRDNGVGVYSSEVTNKLLYIGMSSKDYTQEAGFRGIGRLAGIAYCKRLTFKTSASYEDETSVISFDCEGIRESFSPSRKNVDELQAILQKYTTQDIHSAKKDDHFFEVIMEDIDTTVSQFLEFQTLENYLCQVAPVEFDAQQFRFATKIEKWARDNNFQVSLIKLIIRTPEIERQVFKPFKTRYKTRRNDYDLEIKDIEFLTAPDNVPLYWGWYSKTDLLGMFDDDKVAGLRFRRNNISIGGPERVSELFPGNEGRLNSWLLGEIHILSNEIIPNARRDGFESTPGWLKIVEALQPFIKQHCKDCHDASSAANRPTMKIIASAKSVINATKQSMKIGISSHDERDELLASVDKEIKKVTSSLEKRESQEERQQVQSVLSSLKSLKTNLEEDYSFAIDKIKSSLDRKQRKILQEVLTIINSTLSSVECSKSRYCLELLKKSILAKFQS